MTQFISFCPRKFEDHSIEKVPDGLFDNLSIEFATENSVDRIISEYLTEK